MNPFHRKSPLEKLGDSLGDVAKRIPPALAAVGGLAGLAAGSAALSSRRRRSESPDDRS